MLATDYFDRFLAREMPIIVDTHQAERAAIRHGFTALSRYDMPEGIEAALQLRCGAESATDAQVLSEGANVIVAYLAVAPYECSDIALDYSILRLGSLCMHNTLERRSLNYLLLLSSRTLLLCCRGYTLACYLGDEIEHRGDIFSMREGRCYAIGEFMRLPIIARSRRRSSAALDGDFAFDGVVYRVGAPMLKSRQEIFLGELMDRCADGDNRLLVRENEISRVIVNNVDITDEFMRQLISRHEYLDIGEFSLGCADFEVPANWKINSSLNEGTVGASISIDVGSNMSRITFVSAGASLRAA
ncbi:hypothetical protein [Burkholderia sp. Nafp2/4-1b]|uniref:hypothetical protein n=1 Tax=Burkholderia sp. Nafp2/4-1b TaxID=2116686 RepID=UPI0013CE9080|nr:hypothetical protein [Burkholderia sp. Nafp2/4-1b]